MRKPARIHPLADRILRELATRPESNEVVLGGYLALQHHVDYRETQDIDAWWRGRASPAAERAIVETMQSIGQAEGFAVRERRFGETYSVELERDGRRRFSFQIAVRSTELEPPGPSAWPPILIESLADTVGAKMNALVERGSPRDFLDIHTVVTEGLMSAEQCWVCWSRKNAGQTVHSARQKVVLHLSALEMRRPLAKITDPDERRRAETVRRWYRSEFLGCKHGA